MLSILIPTTVRRVSYFLPNIIKYLTGQVEREHAEKYVQILWLGDNKTMTIGRKRNLLLDMAEGEFLVFIDDDDSVADSYIKDVLFAIKQNHDADAIAYDCITMVDGKGKTLSKYSSKCSKYETTMGADGIQQWRGRLAHTMLWRSSIAKSVRFPDKSWTEDMDWVQRANPLVKKEVQLNKVLYYYRMYHSVSESRTDGVGGAGEPEFHKEKK